MSEPFIDLTPEFRSAVNRRRRQPMWNVLWLGFALGCAFVGLVFAIVTIAARTE